MSSEGMIPQLMGSLDESDELIDPIPYYTSWLRNERTVQFDNILFIVADYELGPIVSGISLDTLTHVGINARFTMFMPTMNHLKSIERYLRQRIDIKAPVVVEAVTPRSKMTASRERFTIPRFGYRLSAPAVWGQRSYKTVHQGIGSHICELSCHDIHDIVHDTIWAR